MNRSSRLKDISNQRVNLWDEPDSDTSSVDKSTSDSDSSSDENSHPSPKRTCCLICSILPNLSTVNTCQKHLALLSTPMAPTQVVYMMHPAVENRSKSCCHCRSKRRCRSSSSSSSSELQRHRKKRSMTILSSDSSSEDELFFSPNNSSQVTSTNIQQQHQSNHSQARLSPSLPPSTNVHTKMKTNLQQYQQLVLTSFLQQTNQRNENEISSILKDTQNRQNSEANTSDIADITSDSSCSSPISNHRIIHVKDDNEVYNDTERKAISINMTQMTEEMQNHEYPQPIIFLERVCLDKNTPIYE